MSICSFKHLASSLLIAALVSGCGGERGAEDGTGATPSPTPTPETPTNIAQGLWEGSTSTGRGIFGLVVSDGSYYVLYSPVGDPTTIGGVILGTGSTSGGTFRSTNGKDFNLEGLSPSDATVSATATSKTSFNGSVAYGSTTVTFATEYINDYETKATLASITGNFVGESAIAGTVQNSTVSISSSGTLLGNAEGCEFNGSVTPRTDGNAYNVTIAFSTPGACLYAGLQFSGLAYFDAQSGVLHAVMPHPARTDVVLFIGTRTRT